MFATRHLTSLTSSSRVTSLLGLAFLAYAGASAHSLFAATQLVTLAVCFVAGSWMDKSQVKVIWTTALILLCLQFPLIFFDMPFGLFGNANFFGIAMAMGLAATLGYNQYWAVPFCVSGVILSFSRTAFLSAGAVLFAYVWNRSRFFAMLLFLLSLLAIFADSGTQNKVDSIFTRIGIWQDTIEHLTIFGSGWGSYFDSYWSWPVHRNIGFFRAAHVYNDYLEAIHDLGIGSIFLWAFLAFCLEGTDRPSWLIVIAFGTAALTHFPLSIPPCGQLFALALGQLYRSSQWQDGA